MSVGASRNKRVGMEELPEELAVAIVDGVDGAADLLSLRAVSCAFRRRADEASWWRQRLTRVRRLLVEGRSSDGLLRETRALGGTAFAAFCAACGLAGATLLEPLFAARTPWTGPEAAFAFASPDATACTLLADGLAWPARVVRPPGPHGDPVSLPLGGGCDAGTAFVLADPAGSAARGSYRTPQTQKNGELRSACRAESISVHRYVSDDGNKNNGRWRKKRSRRDRGRRDRARVTAPDAVVWRVPGSGAWGYVRILSHLLSYVGRSDPARVSLVRLPAFLPPEARRAWILAHSPRGWRAISACGTARRSRSTPRATTTAWNRSSARCSTRAGSAATR